MANVIKFLFLTFLIITSNCGLAMGPACYGQCVVACGTMGPFKFAAFVGVILDILGCSAMCMPICAGVMAVGGMAIPGLCFSEETTFKNGTLLVTDLQVHHDIHGNVVEEIIKFEGSFDFIDIQLKNQEQTKNLSVTPQHWVFASKQWKRASALKLKEKMISESGQEIEIVSLTLKKKDKKYWIQGSSQEVYASGIFTGTSCDQFRYPISRNE